MISWIKLDVNILDDAKIKIIRSHPDGNTIVILWIGLLCLAMKSSRPGIIEISDGIPYTADDLSGLFNIEKKTIELGLSLFAKYRMIDLFDGNTLEIINFSKHQSIEELERKRELTRVRVGRYRDKLKGNALLTHDQRKVTLTDKIRQDKIRQDKKPIVEVFEEFWKNYPRKVNKKEAMKAFNKVTVSLDIILKAIEKQKKSDQWMKDGGQYIPYPSTWLNKERWNDELTYGGNNGKPNTNRRNNNDRPGLDADTAAEAERITEQFYKNKAAVHDAN